MGAAGGGKAKGARSHGVQTAPGELQERDLQQQEGEPEGGRKRQVGGHRDALASMVLSPPPGSGHTDILPCPWPTQGKGAPPTWGSAGPREVGPAAWVVSSPLQRVPDGPGKLAGVPAQELARGSQTAREFRPSPFIQQILIDTQDLLGSGLGWALAVLVEERGHHPALQHSQWGCGRGVSNPRRPRTGWRLCLPDPPASLLQR